jgi:hypothetical protein
VEPPEPRESGRERRPDLSVLWRAALAQALTVSALALALAVTVPHSFFEDWGWVAGPVIWLGCAAITAWVLRLEWRRALVGAVLSGILSALAVLVGVHWLGLVVAVGVFAAWCAWDPTGTRGRPMHRAPAGSAGRAA